MVKLLQVLVCNGCTHVNSWHSSLYKGVLLVSLRRTVMSCWRARTDNAHCAEESAASTSQNLRPRAERFLWSNFGKVLEPLVHICHRSEVIFHSYATLHIDSVVCLSTSSLQNVLDTTTTIIIHLGYCTVVLCYHNLSVKDIIVIYLSGSFLPRVSILKAVSYIVFPDIRQPSCTYSLCIHSFLSCRTCIPLPSVRPSLSSQ